MNDPDRERIAELLRQAMPQSSARLDADLWPRMLRELDRKPRSVPWLDWALALAAIAWCLSFPGAIHMVLYQL